MIAPKEERLNVGELFKKEIKDAEIPGTEAYKRMEDIANEIMKNIEKGNPFIDLQVNKMLDKYQQEIVDSTEPRIIVEAGAGARKDQNAN